VPLPSVIVLALPAAARVRVLTLSVAEVPKVKLVPLPNVRVPPGELIETLFPKIAV